MNIVEHLAAKETDTNDYSCCSVAAGRVSKQLFANKFRFKLLNWTDAKKYFVTEIKQQSLSELPESFKSRRQKEFYILKCTQS